MSGNKYSKDSRLLELMSECGHFLYHKQSGKNGQKRIIRILAENESISQKELQQCLHIQPGSMSEILSKMEEGGLVVRERNSEDKRKAMIKITEKGMQSYEEIENERKYTELFSVLNEDEKAHLDKILTKLTKEWEESFGTRCIDRDERNSIKRFKEEEKDGE